MKLEFGNTENVSLPMLKGHAGLLHEYTATLARASKDAAYTSPEAALYTPFDAGALAATRALAEKYIQVRTVFVVGIGGSDLACRAVYDAVRGHVAQYAGKQTADTPELLFFETVEPEVLSALAVRCKEIQAAEDVLLVVVSKSGATLETLTNAQAIYRMLEECFGTEAAVRQTVLIGNEHTPLHKQAQEKGFTFLSTPRQVGGRFSTCTAANLFPLAVAGVDIAALCEGAQHAIANAVSATAERPSGAHLRAALLFEAWLKETCIHEVFVFHPRLEMLGKWYRQLLAESIGKEQSDGHRIGIMPTVAVGTTDLHSLGQLIFGGPANRVTTFIAIPSLWDCPELQQHDARVVFGCESMDGHSVGDVPATIFDALREEYVQHNLPHSSFVFDGATEREIGAYMGLEMVSVMLLGSLFDINAFDQPAVEAYKEGTRKKLLEKNGGEV